MAGLEQFITSNPWIVALLALWVLPWKGAALWMAARRDHLVWFIALLIINTFAILDIIYIFLVARRYNVEFEKASLGDKREPKTEEE